MKTFIAILEDDENRLAAMKEALRAELPEYDAVFFDSAPDMIAWLRGHATQAAVISLDHDLGPNRERDGVSFDPGTGRDVADLLATLSPHCPVILATTNTFGRIGMETALQDAGWRATKVVPFGDLLWIERDWLPALRMLLSPSGKSLDQH
jgi:hypothetical protein